MNKSLTLIGSIIVVTTSSSAMAQSDGKWSLTRTFYGSEAGRPAVFSYKQDYTDSVSYAVKMALLYRVSRGDSGYNSASAELNLSQKNNSDNDAVRFRYGQFHVLERAPSRRLFLNWNAKFESDQEFGKDSIFAEFVLVPEDRKHGLNVRKFSSSETDLENPTLPHYTVVAKAIAEPGYALDIPATNERNLTRFGVAGGFSYSIPMGKNFRDVTLSVMGKSLYLAFQPGNKLKSIFTLGLDLNFTENTALSLSYVNGFDSPSFNRENAFEVAFGIKF